ncbi:prepilin-type N-terminal cleavage/methylation domain-containing protein [Limimonas halophila]|uniref:Prepilin-type N-terminal cleavage/methylation domain-containing protein n=1 Tax=Limimonas halophila TaxID=1082479 RepID=A0A1G7NMY5_9PROT|nr:prepilin-type N-terminal cleavage/methylation domain-containing protein [Limimonas halophila]SDF75445.1 prepilin-type N-terminal cleavage/methylation domain-containing protein [Limimonas halophila]
MTVRKRTSQGGFTLVELAVVLLIIGLIVGGILRGQELITSAQLNSVQTETNQIRTATNTFRDRFQALPGDFSDAGLIDQSGLNNALDDGNENGRIDGSRVGTAGDEGNQFWAHLGASGLLDGVDADDIAGNGLSGANAFEAAVGGFYSIGQGAPGAFAGNISNRDPWFVLATGGANDAGNVTSHDVGVLDPEGAAQLDRKMDDGNADAGNVRGGASGGSCVGGNGDYDVDSNGDCGLAMRL